MRNQGSSAKRTFRGRGPTEQSAIKPKLFSEACLPPIAPATPTPSAMMNGTVIGPVVTPPESNASGTNAFRPTDTMSIPSMNSTM